MNVLLFQLDGKLPNLALMRISAHHKARGDRVDFRLAFKPRSVEPDLWDDEPDLVYASLIFEKLYDIRSGNFRVCFNQGINVRTLTDDQARELATVRYSDSKFERPRLYCAWDNRKDEDTLFRGLERLRAHGVRPDNIMVYVLIGYDHREKKAQPWLTDDDFYRHRKLRDFGCRPYPMPYVRTPELMGFQRWIVRRDDLKVTWERWVRAKYQPANL